MCGGNARPDGARLSMGLRQTRRARNKARQERATAPKRWGPILDDLERDRRIRKLKGVEEGRGKGQHTSRWAISASRKGEGNDSGRKRAGK